MKLKLTTLALGLAVMSCGGEEPEAQAWPLSEQDVTLVRFTDKLGVPLWDFGHSAKLGWHVADARNVTATAAQPAEGAQSLESFFGGEGGGGSFVGATVRTSGFASGTAGSGGYSGSPGSASGFSGGMGAASGFNATLSVESGTLTCDLGGFCLFFGALCQGFEGDAGECQAAVSECQAEISSVVVPAGFEAVFCALVDLLVCVFSSGDIESTASTCAAEIGALEALGADFEGGF